MHNIIGHQDIGRWCNTTSSSITAVTVSNPWPAIRAAVDKAGKVRCGVSSNFCEDNEVLLGGEVSAVSDGPSTWRLSMVVAVVLLVPERCALIGSHVSEESMRSFASPRPGARNATSCPQSTGNVSQGGTTTLCSDIRYAAEEAVRNDLETEGSQRSLSPFHQREPS